MVTKLDHKPEYKQYKDTGCKYAPSCLDCPYQNCLEEEFRGAAKMKKERRDNSIKALHEDGLKEKSDPE